MELLEVVTAGASPELQRFAQAILPYAVKTAEGETLREEGWKAADVNANGAKPHQNDPLNELRAHTYLGSADFCSQAECCVPNY